MDWRKRADCRNVEDPDVFYASQVERRSRALASCRRCTVKGECLLTALEVHPEEDFGIWGATTVTTRHQIREIAGLTT